VPKLCAVEPGNRITDKDQPVIQVSDRVPGERARVVMSGRSTEDGSHCTVIVIHEQDGTWAIHGLGNPGVRLPPADMVALSEAVLERAR
jgi:hypothetical protein